MSLTGRELKTCAYVTACALAVIVPLSSFGSQLLAVFRFLCLQLGYAAFRLRHWWVVAVSRPGLPQTRLVFLQPLSSASSPLHR